jgi:Putative prokaryotic signal transducing protein
VKQRGKIIPFPASRRVAPPPPVDDQLLVEVRRCRDQGEALVVRGLLDSVGIPSVLRGALVSSLHPFSVGEQAEVGVLVHRADAARAADILGEPRAGGTP